MKFYKYAGLGIVSLSAILIATTWLSSPAQACTCQQTSPGVYLCENHCTPTEVGQKMWQNPGGSVSMVPDGSLPDEVTGVVRNPLPAPTSTPAPTPAPAQPQAAAPAPTTGNTVNNTPTAGGTPANNTPSCFMSDDGDAVCDGRGNAGANPPVTRPAQAPAKPSTTNTAGNTSGGKAPLAEPAKLFPTTGNAANPTPTPAVTAGGGSTAPAPTTPNNLTAIMNMPVSDEMCETTNGVLITDFGAVANPSTDNLGAINRAISAAKGRGVPAVVPAGTFGYRGIIRLDGAKLCGLGHQSVLYALDWANESIFMYGSGSEVRNLRLTNVQAPGRQSPWEATHITLFGATNFVIDGLRIENASAASIQTAQGAGNGRISNNHITDSLSDTIHMTDGAHDILVENNLIERSGDDGIAVVSYRGDGRVVNNIVARNNRVLNNVWGRNMSVVGGSNVHYENNYLDTNSAGWACFYLSQESSYNTYGVTNVTLNNNTLVNCGGKHSGLLLYDDGGDDNNNITITRNSIIQRGQKGIEIYGNRTRNVTLDSNNIVGANPDYVINSPGVNLIRYTGGAAGAAGM